MLFCTVKEVECIEEELEESNKLPKLEPDREFELFVLYAQKPNHTVKIGTTLPIPLHMKLVKILVE